MYERFTDCARTVMQLANGAAHYFNHGYITTEHILLGLLQEGSGLAANVLRNLDIDLDKLDQEIEKVVPRGPYKFSRDKLPQSPCVKQVIADAIEEAELLDHRYVGTEHLLLGLVRQKESVAGQVLMNLGLKLEEVRSEVLQWLGREIPAENPSSVPPRSKVVPPSAESERIRSLEAQLWNLRVVLGAAAGAGASALLSAEKEVVVVGLILGGLVAGLGGRILGAVVGGITGFLLGATHMPGQVGIVGGVLLGALAGVLIAETGGTSGFRSRRK
jgi:hypothetical protein